MTGIVNNIGARSGVIGTTVGRAGGLVVNAVAANYTTPVLVTCYHAWTDTGLTATLTDATSGNHVYAQISLSAGTMNDDATTIHFRLMRDSTVIGGVGANSSATGADVDTAQNVNVGGHYTSANSNRMFNTAFVYKDVLVGSGSLVYKVQCYTNATETVAINRSGTDSTNGYGIRGCSTILIEEIQI